MYVERARESGARERVVGDPEAPLSREECRVRGREGGKLVAGGRVSVERVDKLSQGDTHGCENG